MSRMLFCIRTCFGPAPMEQKEPHWCPNVGKSDLNLGLSLGLRIRASGVGMYGTASKVPCITHKSLRAA